MQLKCPCFVSLGTRQPVWKKLHVSSGFFSGLGLFLLLLSSLCAANFSTPVISTSDSSNPGQERTYTCMSKNGYPEPNLYWINTTDNSLIDTALQNNTVYLNKLGLYDVISTLRLPWTSRGDVLCCVENVALHQNITSISQAESFTGNNTKNPQETHNNELKVLVPVLAVLAAAAFVSFIIYRRTRPHRSYTGPKTVQLELTDHA